MVLPVVILRATHRYSKMSVAYPMPMGAKGKKKRSMQWLFTLRSYNKITQLDVRLLHRGKRGGEENRCNGNFLINRSIQGIIIQVHKNDTKPMFAPMSSRV